MKTREELEKQINDDAITLVSINREADGERFVAEERKLVSTIVELTCIIYSQRFGKIGYEIVITAKECISGYKPDKGLFVNYYNSALAKNLKRQEVDENDAVERGTIKIGREKIKTIWKIRNYEKYAEVRGADIHAEGFPAKVASALNMSVEDVEDAMLTDAMTKVLKGDAFVFNKEGDKNITLFDSTPDKTATTDGALMNKISALDIISSINAIIETQQERTKTLLKKLLTVKVIEALEMEEASFMENVMREATFIDQDVYINYKEHGKLPNALEIAKKFGKHESHISRVLKIFRK